LRVLDASGRVLGRLLALWLTCAPCVAGALDRAPVPEHTARFEYLYIEANEGGSSGGHTAVRFGDQIYHFENRGGLLVLATEPSAAFVHAYAQLGNRPMHTREIAVTPETALQLRRQFELRRQAQAAQLDVATALREDTQLLERWQRAAAQAEAPGADARAVPAAGYFLPVAADDGALRDRRSVQARDVTSRAIATLRARVAAEHGADVFARREAWLRAQLEHVAAPGRLQWPVTLPSDAYERPPLAYPFARRHLDLVSGLAALEILAAARPLRGDALITLEAATVPGADGPELDDHALDVLARFARDLESALAALVVSERPDFGQPLLVGMARLAALHQSLETGRLVFLDAFASDAESLDGALFAARQDLAPHMMGEAQEQLDAARDAFFRDTPPGESPDERSWSRLEQQANRSHELLRGIRSHRDVRVERGHLIPSRSARYGAGQGVAPPLAGLDAALARARDREAHYAERLQALHGYHLIGHNCVSEIFTTLQAAFEDGASSPSIADAWAREAIGGQVAERGALGFVPFLSAATVDARYRVVARRTIPSLRAWRIREMRGSEDAIRVALRESNTLTSTSYRRAHRDSFFLFFTDRHVALRPLFGAANLLAGLGESLWGLVRLPVDRGETLVSGLRGSAWSLPELAFLSIRKGSNDWAPRRPADPSPGAE
jgi:hypothetical protein